MFNLLKNVKAAYGRLDAAVVAWSTDRYGPCDDDELVSSSLFDRRPGMSLNNLPIESDGVDSAGVA